MYNECTHADPRVFERLVRLDPLGRVDRQHLIDEVLGLGRHRVPLGRRVVVGAGLDLRVQPVLVLVPEGRVAHEQDVEDHPARPDVHRLPVRLLLQHLNSNRVFGNMSTAQ